MLTTRAETTDMTRPVMLAGVPVAPAATADLAAIVGGTRSALVTHSRTLAHLRALQHE